MIISKNTDLKDLSFIKDGDKLEITKDIALNRQFLIMLAERFPHSDITVLSGYNSVMTQYSSQQPFFNTAETKVFVENLNYLRSKYSKDVTFDDMFSTTQALDATRKFNATVKHIKALKINGRPLSPLEKFYAAYSYVTQRMYNETELIENSALSRNLINVLTADKIVCVGYTNWLIALLKELDIPCTYQAMVTQDKETGEVGNHATLCVRIVDPIYRVNGIFHSDPTADASKEKHFSLGMNSFECALVPYSNVPEIYTCLFDFDKSLSSVDGAPSGQYFENRTPKVLSALFPEITQNRTQDVIISDIIKKSISDMHIRENTLGFLDVVDQDYIDHSLDQHIQELLNLKDFCTCFDEGRIKQHLNSISISMISLGLSRSEACDYISTHLTEEAIADYYISKNNNSLNPQPENVIKKHINKVSGQISKLQDLIQRYPMQNVEVLSDYEILQSISQNLCRTVVYNAFSGETSRLLDLAEITTLQKNGYALQDILNSLKDLVEGEDLFEHYLYHNQHLVAPLKHPEDEFYLGMVQPYYILNQPYEDLFAEIAAQTKTIKAKDIQIIFENLFVAEGCSVQSAKRQTERALKRTDLLNPSIFGQ